MRSVVRKVCSDCAGNMSGSTKILRCCADIPRGYARIVCGCAKYLRECAKISSGFVRNQCECAENAREFASVRNLRSGCAENLRGRALNVCEIG